MSTALFMELETRLMDSIIHASREKISALLADDFMEFGIDGKVYDKASIVIAVTTQAATGALDYDITDLSVRMLATDAAFVTYRVQWRGAVSLRSSVWKLIDENWLLTFHQGTRA
jgi:hypothetical protein